MHAGVAFVGIQERANCGAPAANAPAASTRRRSRLTGETKVAPTFGIGLTFYPANFISLGVEYRALPFSWNRAGLRLARRGHERQLTPTT